ncbi:MAG: SPOR domain-containing protein [Fidelibacterota bacterium]
MTNSRSFRVSAVRVVGTIALLCVLAGGQDAVKKDSVVFDESFDPETLTEPSLDWPVILHSGETLPEQGEREPTDTTEEGYRIQVISTLDYGTADSLMGELLPVFSHQVYLTFDPPNYKVRVGNFKFRSSAEDAQRRLRDMGFRSAWIIRTQIESVPDGQAR